MLRKAFIMMIVLSAIHKNIKIGQDCLNIAQLKRN